MSSNNAFREVLEERVLVFGANVLNALHNIPEVSAFRVVSYQLAKSATSMGANYSEANHSESVDDFVHKISIVVKEAKETLFWLGMIERVNFLTDEQKSSFVDLKNEAGQLFALFLTSQRTVRERKLSKDRIDT